MEIKGGMAIFDSLMGFAPRPEPKIVVPPLVAATSGDGMRWGVIGFDNLPVAFRVGYTVREELELNNGIEFLCDFKIEVGNPAVVYSGWERVVRENRVESLHDVIMDITLYRVLLVRERLSTEGYARWLCGNEVSPASFETWDAWAKDFWNAEMRRNTRALDFISTKLKIDGYTQIKSMLGIEDSDNYPWATRTTLARLRQNVRHSWRMALNTRQARRESGDE